MDVRIKTLPLFSLVFSLFLLFSGCQSKKVIYTPEGYNLTEPEENDLGTKLFEVSGICWVNDTNMLANNDESGRIFALNPQRMKDFNYRTVKFGDKDDYEDIVKVDSAVYVLQSTGKILEITDYQTDTTVRAIVVAELGREGNEFESMYYDKSIHSLIMLCKKCHKEKDQFRAAYRFDLKERKLIDSPYFKVDINLIKSKLDDNRQEFQPSAAAINPVQNKIYMISSIGKVLVITDMKGKVEHAIAISPTLFVQPEGMTFSANGDMFISNEGATEPTATLLRFRFGNNPRQR